MNDSSTTTISTNVVNNNNNNTNDDDDDEHRKRLIQILRYIASWHQTTSREDHSFVQRVPATIDFYQNNNNNNINDDHYDDSTIESSSSLSVCGVICSTRTFCKLVQLEQQQQQDVPLFSSPPFSFYAANTTSSTTTTNRKRNFAGAFLSSSSTNHHHHHHPSSSSSNTTTTSSSSYWLRLTRLTRAQQMREPQIVENSAVQTYLNDWIQWQQRSCASSSTMTTATTANSSYQQLLLLLSSPRQIDQLLSSSSTTTTATAEEEENNNHYPPKLTRPVKLFLKRYKKYLLMKRYQQQLEPIYNQLFEWTQTNNNNKNNNAHQELVWGLGHAQGTTTNNNNNNYINGPLLDVLVEVELASDGALLLKPRHHTGVTLNRQVLAAFQNSSTENNSSSSMLAKWHRNVADLEPTQLSPGQPMTYIPFLQQMAVDLCAGGSFQPYASGASTSTTTQSSSTTGSSSNSLMVSEAWCLYSRLKPSSVWARDANGLADQLSTTTTNQQEVFQLPLATWSLTHGPNQLEEQVIEQKKKKYNNNTNKNSSWLQWLSSYSFASEKKEQNQKQPTNKKKKKKKNYIFPLETSESQNRIAHLLLEEQYPAVVTEGPPGTGKTHSIANMICAYLAQGKRVLVTSKNASALSVIRERLPSPEIQELCVDVSQSEAMGMRQLQQTVERLANRISWEEEDNDTTTTMMMMDPDDESNNNTTTTTIVGVLEQRIYELEQQVLELENQKSQDAQKIRTILSKEPKLSKLGCTLLEEAPWLLQSLDVNSSSTTNHSTTTTTSSSIVAPVTMEDLNNMLKQLQTIQSFQDDTTITIALLKQVQNLKRPFLFKPELLSMILRKSKEEDAADAAATTNDTKKGMSSFSFLNNIDVTSKEWIRSKMEMTGLFDNYNRKQQELKEELEQITFRGQKPQNQQEWKIVAKALLYNQAIAKFENEFWTPRVILASASVVSTHSKQQQQHSSSLLWPQSWDFSDSKTVSNTIHYFQMAMELQTLMKSLKITEQTTSLWNDDDDYWHRSSSSTTTTTRSSSSSSLSYYEDQIRQKAQELVNAKVIAALNQSFSPNAQSALIRFAQIAGSNRFGGANKNPSKMTQRQRRRRQEYLRAFDQCCRFIPCWILTTGQISDYLPAEGCLFDLVILDEASQSDVTVLPGMLRGKQWLIVGDGKQVSPTEAFVSEEEIDNLRAQCPSWQQERSLLPGQSFFDLCAQAFPRGRVVLSEHFRCAPDIIEFSNEQFYDGRLVPLRLPTQSERLTPSLIDVKVNNGVKVGKINEREADKIVEMIQDYMNHNDHTLNDDAAAAAADTTHNNLQQQQQVPPPPKKRSIGVISLIGDEQSRLIRGRLLDVVGPEKMAQHQVLIGDPPSFQGAERDIIFLSMVCSPDSVVPTQSQLMHFQRANVAMSRARDRCVLVRSIELTDIPSMDDMKIPIIQFFLSKAAAAGNNTNTNNEDLSFLAGTMEGRRLDTTTTNNNNSSMQRRRRSGNSTLILKKLLTERGYAVTDMGIVWKNGICIEHPNTENRAALLVDCDEEMSHQEWKSSYAQQKAIERVGWKCYRIDLLSLFANYNATMKSILQFLASIGIEEPIISMMNDDLAELPPSQQPEVNNVEEEEEHAEQEEEESDCVTIEDETAAAPVVADEVIVNAPPIQREHEIVTISSDEESIGDSKKPAAADSTSLRPDPMPSAFGSFERDSANHADRFGQVVDLDFLRRRPDDDSGNVDDEEQQSSNNSERKERVEHSSSNVARLPDSLDSSSVDGKSVQSRESKRKYKYRKLDKYSRDGRWYPGKATPNNSDDEFEISSIL